MPTAPRLQITASAQRQWLGVAAVGVAGLLVLVAASELWRFHAERPALPHKGATPEPTRIVADAGSSVDYAALADSHLFGIYRASPPDTQQADAAAVVDTESEIPDSAPETSLNLSLNGVVYSATNDARAIISVDGKHRKFAVGDEIKADVVIHAIEQRRVVIRNAGKFETISLPRATMSQQTPATASTSRPSRTATASALAERLRQMR